MGSTGGSPTAILLSGSLGMGHEVMASVVEASLTQRGWTTVTVDCMELLGRGARIGNTAFRRLLAVPPLYDAFHFGALRPGGRLARAMDRAALWQMLPRLRELADRTRPRLLLGLFATGAAAASALKRENPSVATAVLNTDAVSHAMWVHPDIDLYLVTSEVAAASVLGHDPLAQTMIVPSPVRPAFFTPPSRRAARSTLGIPVDAHCVLLMAGGWGLGPIASAARAIADSGVDVLAVAGRNARLAALLEDAAQTRPHLHPIGFSNDVPQLMAACDLVVTAAGGNTCAEARVSGRHLLLLDVMPGHGRDNLQHELELGDASVSSGDPAEVVLNVLSLLPRITLRNAPTRSMETWDRSLDTAISRLGLPPVSARVRPVVSG